MNVLNTQTNLSGHDDLYEKIVDMHEGLTIEESLKATAKLALLLANHIGDPAVISEAVAIASKTPSAPKGS